MSIFQKAERRKAKLKLALCGPSGSGKTFSALQIAKGMGGKIAFIDTENGSGQLYSHVAEYDVCEIGPPFAVEKYISAIKAAEESGYNILIIDSLSHAWAKQGGILDEVDKRGGKNAFTSGWREATPMHDKFVDAILQSPLHIIATMRAKTAYELEKDDKGRTIPVKKGMEPVQRAGLEYEFTVVLDMDNARHTATSGKDRTGLFDGKCFTPDESTGAELMRWLETGIEAQPQYYNPQYQQQFMPQPAEMSYCHAPVQPAQPAAPVYGFPYHEQEIVYYMTAVWGNLSNFDIPAYIQQRYGRPPMQLAAEECFALKNEFAAYAAQKSGGN